MGRQEANADRIGHPTLSQEGDGPWSRPCGPGQVCPPVRGPPARQGLPGRAAAPDESRGKYPADMRGRRNSGGSTSDRKEVNRRAAGAPAMSLIVNTILQTGGHRGIAEAQDTLLSHRLAKEGAPGSI